MAKHHRTPIGTTPRFILIALMMLVAVPHRLNAECPPLGLATHDDYLVDVGFRYWGPTVGIDECGRFIVAYWAEVIEADLSGPPTLFSPGGSFRTALPGMTVLFSSANMTPTSADSRATSSRPWPPAEAGSIARPG